MNILITRHPETKNNAEKNIQSHDHAELTEKGKKELQQLLAQLKSENIEVVISSDSPRCVLTAEAITKKIGVPFTTDALLREKNGGAWGGTKKTQQEWDALKGTFETRKPPKGESLLETLERAKNVLKKVIEKNNGKNVLLVAHGTISKLLVGHALGMSIKDSILNLEITHCSLTTLRYDSERKRMQLIRFNDICHTV